MRILVWLLRVVVVAVVVKLAWHLLVSVIRAASGTGQSRPADRSAARAGGALVRDPQCGTYVMQSRALTTGAGDAAHYFCSDACRTAWLAAHPQ